MFDPIPPILQKISSKNTFLFQTIKKLGYQIQLPPTQVPLGGGGGGKTRIYKYIGVGNSYLSHHI